MKRAKTLQLGKLLVFAALLCGAAALAALKTAAQNEKIQISANFDGREIAARETVELKLSRPLQSGEGRFAVFVGETDLTALFNHAPEILSYAPTALPLQAGENQMIVYLVSPQDEWEKLAEFVLKVKEEVALEAAKTEAAPDKAVETNGVNSADRWAFEFTPTLSLNGKGQNQILTFPRDSAPERNPFAETDGQAGVFFKVTRGGWSLANKFDFVGVGFRQNALRFGELREKAPRVDLSSYLVEFGKGRFNVRLGHVSFGSNRHLINSFSSRGVTVTVPLGKQNEIILAAANGTSVVGFDNFLGVSRRKHSILSATFAREFYKERPGALRVEASVLRGSLLPIANFNQREVNDAEKSVGFGFRVAGSDKTQRLRWEAGFTRSRFTNPADPLLEQGFEVTRVRPVWKNARFLEVSFDFLRDLKVWREKKMKLTGTYRHEEIEPLFRSIAASLQADRRQNQFEISGNFGEINFAVGNLRDRDNLNDLTSILKSLTRRNNVVVGVPLNSFFTPDKPIKWLPQISYSYDQVHNFGAFLPTSGDFRDLSQVPDQMSRSHSFNAQWQLSERLSAGYRLSRAFQDNRQPGRERADFASLVNGWTVGYKPHADLDLDFELSRESQTNFEQPRTDRTFRGGGRAAWRTPFLKNSAFSAGFSTTLAGDTKNINDSRNIEFDAQWAYRFQFGKEKFKKMDAQFFIRYANRYGDARDRLFFVNNFNKAQTFNAGLMFNFF